MRSVSVTNKDVWRDSAVSADRKLCGDLALVVLDVVEEGLSAFGCTAANVAAGARNDSQAPVFEWQIDLHDATPV